MALADAVGRLYLLYGSELDEDRWVSERARWAELVFALVASEAGAEGARSAVAALDQLGLLDAADFGTIVEDEERELLVAAVLRQHGLGAEAATRVLRLLLAAVVAIETGYAGKLQRFVRRHAETMRSDMEAWFAAVEHDRDRVRAALTLWMQNAFDLPLSLADNAVSEFCHQRKATVDELVELADQLDINVAIVDDLIHLDADAASEQRHE